MDTRELSDIRNRRVDEIPPLREVPSEVAIDISDIEVIDPGVVEAKVRRFMRALNLERNGNERTKIEKLLLNLVNIRKEEKTATNVAIENALEQKLFVYAESKQHENALTTAIDKWKNTTSLSETIKKVEYLAKPRILNWNCNWRWPINCLYNTRFSHHLSKKTAKAFVATSFGILVKGVSDLNASKQTDSGKKDDNLHSIAITEITMAGVLFITPVIQAWSRSGEENP